MDWPKAGRSCQPIVRLVKLTWKNLGGTKWRREEMTCSAHLPETLMLESILAERRATRKDPESDQLPAKQDEHPDNLKLTPSPKA